MDVVGDEGELIMDFLSAEGESIMGFCRSEGESIMGFLSELRRVDNGFFVGATTARDCRLMDEGECGANALLIKIN